MKEDKFGLTFGGGADGLGFASSSSIFFKPLMTLKIPLKQQQYHAFRYHKGRTAEHTQASAV